MQEIHYDLLRGERVQSVADLKVGKFYMFCHVPFDNPYTEGSGPFRTRARVKAVWFASPNETYMKKYPLKSEHGNEKQWMVLLEEGSMLHPGKIRERWRHASDMGLDCEWFNFVLDEEALEEKGIAVLDFPSVEYIRSPDHEGNYWEN